MTQFSKMVALSLLGAVLSFNLTGCGSTTSDTTTSSNTEDIRFNKEKDVDLRSFALAQDPQTNDFVLRWDPIAGASYYEVKIASNILMLKYAPPTKVNNAKFPFPPLLDGEYWVEVKAEGSKVGAVTSITVENGSISMKTSTEDSSDEGNTTQPQDVVENYFTNDSIYMTTLTELDKKLKEQDEHNFVVHHYKLDDMFKKYINQDNIHIADDIPTYEAQYKQELESHFDNGDLAFYTFDRIDFTDVDIAKVENNKSALESFISTNLDKTYIELVNSGSSLSIVRCTTSDIIDLNISEDNQTKSVFISCTPSFF